MTFKDFIVKQILDELSFFSGAQFDNPIIRAAITTTTMAVLKEIQSKNPGFDAKTTFEFTLSPKVTITWWKDFPKKRNTFVVSLHPLAVFHNQDDPYSAYERAMSIL